MSRNTDVFQVLVPTVATPAATGTTLDALATGAIGAFSYATNVALNPAATPTEDFYLAVKVLNVDGVADIVKSSGTHVQIKNKVSYTFQPYVAPVEMVTNNKLKVIKTDSEIGVRIEMRNQEAYRINGYNQVVKTFIVPTSPSGDCVTSCEDENCADTLTALVDLINSDEDGVFTATQVAPTDCDGTTLDGELIITVNSKAFGSFCDINLNYFSPRQTEIIVTPIEGFEPTTITTAMVYEEGSGYDVKQLEYEAGGWNGKPGPYRTFNDGLAQTGFKYYADSAKNYAVFNASYDQNSISGWRSDDHFLRTIVAAETGAVATGVKTFLDFMFA